MLAVLRGDEARIVVKSEEISDVMKQAIVAVEDRRFFEHRGIDLRGIARAIWQDLRNRAVVEGGSTITQQFVKNAYVKSSRSFERKLNEAALAWQLEQQWSKDRILTAYLNTIYFGNGAYGIEQASRVYFRHRAASLSLAESALLAGIPADPTLYDPVCEPAPGESAAAHGAARDARPGRHHAGGVLARRPRAAAGAGDIRLPGIQGPAPYFTNYVKQQLVDRVRHREGLRRRAARPDVDRPRPAAARARGDRQVAAPDDEGPSAALVAIDPRDGRVLAMYGGRNYAESQFNLAVQGSVSRDPRSSRSPSRPRSSRASPPRRPSCRRP